MLFGFLIKNAGQQIQNENELKLLPSSRPSAQLLMPHSGKELPGAMTVASLSSPSLRSLMRLDPGKIAVVGSGGEASAQCNSKLDP